MAAVAAVAQEHIRLAQDLPPRLIRFFTRFPPIQLTAAAQAQPQTITTVSTTSSVDPNVGASTESTPLVDDSTSPKLKKNPFLPWKNPSTGNWHGPQYSLRRQADLFKLAMKHDVLPLMPPSPKHPAIKAEKRQRQGLRVQGTGEGKRVKGHRWERTLAPRLDMRRLAMQRMPDMIALWKETGHGRGWKKYPRGKPGVEEVFDPGMKHAWVHQRRGK